MFMYFRILNEERFFSNPTVHPQNRRVFVNVLCTFCLCLIFRFISQRRHGREEVWIHEIQAEKATFVAASKCWLLSAFVAAEFEVAKTQIHQNMPGKFSVTT